MARNAIKALHALPRGGPFDATALKSIGVSSALAHHYVAAGWLERLGRGVFMFPNDKLTAEACVKFLARKLPGLHVGGKTALAWRGVRHNIRARERLCLWGEAPGKLPPWFTERFPASYAARHLFDAKLPAGFGLQPLPEMPDGPLVAVPERALLELLSEVGLGQGLEEARHLLESVRAPRLEVLGPLLKHCPRVKVVRLCVQWAEELNLDWAAEARRLAGPRGHGRWFGRLPNGRTLILKP